MSRPVVYFDKYLIDKSINICPNNIIIIREFILTISNSGEVKYQLNLKNHIGFVPVILWMSVANFLAPYIHDTAITSKKAM